MNKYYAIPGLYEHYIANILYLDYMKKYPEHFIPNTQINAVYGNFQFCSWDGGRPTQSKVHASIEQIYLLKYIYNDIFNVPMRFIFTNSLLKEEDLYNHFNNLILKICQNNQNEIVVNSLLLENYIRENYKQYNLISSTTKCLNNTEDALKEIHKNYKFICLDYNLNKNFNFLESIDDEIKDKIELLVNPICGLNCKNRANHYKLISNSILNYNKSFALENCKITTSNFDPKSTNRIEPNEIESYYAKNNFLHYKIEGRTFSSEQVILNLVKYTVKPEYQLHVIAALLRNLDKYKNDNKFLTKF